MLNEKVLDRLCPECGESMSLSRDYGSRGAEFCCTSCGFSEEIIELVAPATLSATLA